MLLGSGDADGMSIEQLNEVVRRIEEAEKTGTLQFDSQAAAIALAVSASGVTSKEVAADLADASKEMAASIEKAVPPPKDSGPVMRGSQPKTKQMKLANMSGMAEAQAQMIEANRKRSIEAFLQGEDQPCSILGALAQLPAAEDRLFFCLCEIACQIESAF